jgi:hypothetical protein
MGKRTDLVPVVKISAAGDRRPVTQAAFGYQRGRPCDAPEDVGGVDDVGGR